MPAAKQLAALCAFLDSNERVATPDSIPLEKRPRFHIFTLPVELVPSERPIKPETLQAQYNFTAARELLQGLGVKQEGIFIVSRIGRAITVDDPHADLIENIIQLSPDLVRQWVGQVRFRVRQEDWKVKTLQQKIVQAAGLLDVTWELVGTVFKITAQASPTVDQPTAPCGG